MVRARRHFLLAISVLALECEWGGFDNSGQSCPSEPYTPSNPPQDCTSYITALTLSAGAETLAVGRGALLTSQATVGALPAVSCNYYPRVVSSDLSVAQVTMSGSVASGTGPAITLPVGAVVARAVGGAQVIETAGAGSDTIAITAVAAGDAFVAMSAGGSGACTLDPAGRVYCSTVFLSTAPLLVGGLPPLASVEAGSTGACGISTGKKVFCWTYAWNAPYPASPSQLAVPGDAEAVDASGTSHTCALTTTHDAWCWGSNVYGQLGITGDYGYWVAGGLPVAVSGGHKFRKISVGGDHTCGLGDDGSLWCWGYNGSFELGISAVSGGCLASWCQPTPARVRLVTDSVFTDVAAGFDHTCALDAAGAAWCWGRNSTGALGTADTLSGATPRAVAGGLSFVALTAGMQYTCGLTASGDAWCWGSNYAGQLGTGVLSHACGAAYLSSPCEPSPVKVSGALSFSALSAGSGETCGMTGTGAWCWGMYWGANQTPSDVPVRVPGQP